MTLLSSLNSFKSYERFCEGHFFAENPSTFHGICGKTIWPMSDLKLSSENSRNEDFKNVWHCFLAWIFPKLRTFLCKYCANIVQMLAKYWAHIWHKLDNSLWLIWKKKWKKVCDWVKTWLLERLSPLKRIETYYLSS